MGDDYRRHDIILRDVASPDDKHCPDGMERGCLVVTYCAINDENPTFTESRHVSARLPVECLVLFDGGTLDVGELSADERAWVQAASAERSNEIDFAGTEAGPGVGA